MKPKLTAEPVHYQLVGSDLLAYSVGDLMKTERSIDYAALSIQGFALSFLLVRMKDLEEVIGCMLGLGILDTELLDGVFETGDFGVYGRVCQ